MDWVVGWAYSELMGPGDEDDEVGGEGEFWSPHELDQTNAGSPYLYDSEVEVSERSDDVPNPREWEDRSNPNEDLYDAPNQTADPTGLEWMD